MSGQTTQVEYAKLLAGSTHGDALYIPTPHPEVGDVAHFDDGVYQQLFNIFSMTEEVCNYQSWLLLINGSALLSFVSQSSPTTDLSKR